MFVGHFAIALGAKKYAPEISLGVLFLSCQLADLIWPNLVLLGIETVEIVPGITALTPLDFVHYPYSHSLVALVIWSAIFCCFYWVLKRPKVSVLLVVASVILSHWFLDVLTHRPDMPVTISDSTMVGVGLWNLPYIAVPVELLLYVTGVWVYIRATQASDNIGKYGFWALVIFLLVIYLANVFGPPPPSAEAVAWTAQSLWILVIWGYWVDSHRTSTRN